MKIKKIISFILMLTILFTMNVAPSFADKDKVPEIQITFEGGKGAGLVLISGDGIDEEFPYPDPPTQTLSLTTADIGKSITITVQPSDGSEVTVFEVEKTDYLSSLTHTIENIQGDKYKVKVRFELEEQDEEPEPETYTVTGVADPDDGGVVDPSSEEVEKGESVTLTAEANEGFVFVRWEEEGSELTDEIDDITIDGNTITISNIESDRTITAIFELEDSDDGEDQDNPDGPTEPVKETPPSNPGSSTTYYTLTVEVEGPGSVSPTGGSYARGRTISLNPTANEGAQFVGWFGADGDDVSDANSILMNGNKSVIARFEAIPAEDEFIDEDIPEAGDIVEEEILPDDYVPQAGETLPQTGGIPMELLVGIGFAFIGGGVTLNKKENKKDKK